jgi:hypothetical protein
MAVTITRPVKPETGSDEWWEAFRVREREKWEAFRRWQRNPERGPWVEPREKLWPDDYLYPNQD